jgi:hypothetical protein
MTADWTPVSSITDHEEVHAILPTTQWPAGKFTGGVVHE